MRFSNLQIKKTIIAFQTIFALIAVFSCGAAQAKAQAADGGLKISPSRMDIAVPAGGEKTVGLIVEYDKDKPDAQLPNARIIARLDDWKVAPNGEFSFVPANSTPRSAASWITYSPSEFTLAPGTRQVIRFTVSVPKETAPGDYYLACYVQDRTPPPPPSEGQRQLTISYRFYTIIYVRVPGLTTDGSLQSLEAGVKDGLPVITPKLANAGNSRLRPKHSVEIRDEKDNVVFATPMNETLVVLGGQSWQMPIPVDAELPAGNYKLAYSVDFGDKKEIQVGKTSFVITPADVALRKKSNDANTARKNGEAGKEKQEETLAKAEKETTQTPKPAAAAAPAPPTASENKDSADKKAFAPPAGAKKRPADQ